jgi:hypothetical protein
MTPAELKARLQRAPAGLPLECLNLTIAPALWRQIAAECRKIRESTSRNTRRGK